MAKIRTEIIIGLLLIGIVLAAYLQVVQFKCVFIDDFQCLNAVASFYTSAPFPKEAIEVDENYIRTSGSNSADGANLATPLDLLHNMPALFWPLVPMPLLSALLEAKIFGVTPAVLKITHSTNLWLHIACTLALFLVLRFATNARWQSAFAASLFAVHPMSVEPVSILCQRTYLFGTLFYILSIGLYCKYVGRLSVKKYIILFFLWILSFTSHPSMIHLPLVLFLFDYWPLGRIRYSQQRLKVDKGVWMSKLPLLAVTACISVTAIVVMVNRLQCPRDVIASLSFYACLKRIAAIPIIYMHYLQKIVWPEQSLRSSTLQDSPLLLESGIDLLVLAALTVFVLWQGRRYRYLITGWFWFLITLFPAVLTHALLPAVMPNRQAFLSVVGIYIIFSWAGGDLLSRLKYKHLIAAMSAGMIIIVLLAVSRYQATCWKDLDHYFKMTVEKRAPHNPTAYRNYGVFLRYKNRLPEAVAQLRKALAFKPDYADAHYQLGDTLALMGKTAEALDHYRQALQIDPDLIQVLNNTGNLLADRGRTEDAIGYYRHALEIDPTAFQIHNNLATALLQNGQEEAAIIHFKKALAIRPDYEKARDNLAAILSRRGETGGGA